MDELLAEIGPAGNMLQRGHHRVASNFQIEREERERRLITIQDSRGSSSRGQAANGAFLHGQLSNASAGRLRPEGAERDSILNGVSPQVVPGTSERGGVGPAHAGVTARAFRPPPVRGTVYVSPPDR